MVPFLFLSFLHALRVVRAFPIDKRMFKVTGNTTRQKAFLEIKANGDPEAVINTYGRSRVSPPTCGCPFARILRRFSLTGIRRIYQRGQLKQNSCPWSYVSELPGCQVTTTAQLVCLGKHCDKCVDLIVLIISQ